MDPLFWRRGGDLINLAHAWSATVSDAEARVEGPNLAGQGFVETSDLREVQVLRHIVSNRWIPFEGGRRFLNLARITQLRKEGELFVACVGSMTIATLAERDLLQITQQIP